MNIISQMTISGKTRINGRYVNLTGQNVTITDGAIYVNGKPIEEFDDSQTPIIKIEVTGNVETLTTENGEVTVNGRVGTIVSKNGNVMCATIKGDCETKNGNIMRGY